MAYLHEADDGVFACLRAVGQEGTGLVLAGSSWDWKRVLDQALTMPGSSFGNDLTPVKLGPLAADDAVAFLVSTAPGDVPLAAERTGRWIVELCGSWPYNRPPRYRELSRGERRLARDAGLCDAASAWLDDRPFFEWLQRNLDDLREIRPTNSRTSSTVPTWSPPISRASLRRTRPRRRRGVRGRAGGRGYAGGGDRRREGEK